MSGAFDVPDFLLVKNRVPLTPEQEARVAALQREAREKAKDESRQRLAGRPRSWDAACEAMQRELDDRARAEAQESWELAKPKLRALAEERKRQRAEAKVIR